MPSYVILSTLTGQHQLKSGSLLFFISVGGNVILLFVWAFMFLFLPASIYVLPFFYMFLLFYNDKGSVGICRKIALQIAICVEQDKSILECFDV